MQDFKFDYFYGSQAEQFSFFRLPKILIRDARFKKISSFPCQRLDIPGGICYFLLTRW